MLMCIYLEMKYLPLYFFVLGYIQSFENKIQLVSLLLRLPYFPQWLIAKIQLFFGDLLKKSFSKSLVDTMEQHIQKSTLLLSQHLYSHFRKTEPSSGDRWR